MWQFGIGKKPTETQNTKNRKKTKEDRLKAQKKYDKASRSRTGFLLW